MHLTKWFWFTFLLILAWVGYLTILGPVLISMDDTSAVTFGVVLFIALLFASNYLLRSYLKENKS